MSPVLKPFYYLWRLISFPFRKIMQKANSLRDQQLEKKIRREIEVSLSHELKTPLTSILAYSEILEESMENPSDINLDETKSAIKIIHRKSKDLVRFIDNVILNSMLDFNPYEFKKDKINLSQIAVACLERAKDFYDIQSGITTDIDPDVFIEGNERLFATLFFELLSNAYLYQKPDQKLEISFELKEANRKVRICVRDNGKGIKSKYQKRVFDKFFRVGDILHSDSPGLGIGLNLSKQIVNFHGGHIHFESKYHEGTSISINFDNTLKGQSP